MQTLDQQLLDACQYGDVLTVEKLLQQGANPTATDRDGRSALHYAVESQNHHTAQYLLTQLQLDPNTQDENGITPLMIATPNGDIKMLQLLAQHGADPNITDQHGQTALHYAVEKQYDNIAQYLITELKLDPNSQDQWGLTPFMIAAAKGDIDILKRLIQHGADPYIRNTSGKSALHYAVLHRHHEIVQYLITQLNLDPNSQDHDGKTPFIIATENGDIKMLRLLIQHGVNPYLTDHDGQTALHHAAGRHKPHSTRFLITVLNLNPNSQDLRGNTPLHIALQNGHHDTAQTLIQLGANPHIPNYHGQTPSAIAREHRTRLPKPQPSTITL